MIWLYSGEIEVPEEITETIDLYYLAQEFEVRDLMWRCEEEIILKISPSNVVDVLVRYFPKLNRDMDQEEEKVQLHMEDPLAIIVSNELLDLTTPTNSGAALFTNNSHDSTLQTALLDDQTHFKAELSLKILNTCKTVFLRDFPDVLSSTPNLESKLASVQGLITSLFSHINEVKSKKKKNKVRFSFVEEIHTPISFDQHFDNTDTHSENSIRI